MGGDARNLINSLYRILGCDTRARRVVQIFARAEHIADASELLPDQVVDRSARWVLLVMAV